MNFIGLIRYILEFCTETIAKKKVSGKGFHPFYYVFVYLFTFFLVSKSQIPL